MRLTTRAVGAAATFYLLTTLGGGARAATHGVPGDFPTIQAAIDDAVADDIILVAPGTYRGAGNRDIELGSKALTVRSSDGSSATFLELEASAASAHRGFFLHGAGEGTVIEGFTIHGGYLDDPPPGARAALHVLSGAGILVQGGAPTLRDIVIEGCYTRYTGGGLAIELVSAARVNNVIIRGCHAEQAGGGLSIELGSSPIVKELRVTGNVAPDGGGIYCSSSRPLFLGLLVAGNRADYGGALRTEGIGAIALSRATLWGNCADAEVEGHEISTEPGFSVEVQCAVLDSSGVKGGLASFHLVDNVRYDRPLFCRPSACAGAPSTEGDYSVSLASPCLPDNNSCGELLGVPGPGLCVPSPVRRMTWGAVKNRYQR